MKGLNKVFIMGHIGNDPEKLETKRGKAYTRLSVATRRYRPPQEGEEKGSHLTTWHSVFVWGKLAETCTQYLRRGYPVFVEGYLNAYTSEKEGEKGYELNIVADRVEFLPNKTANVAVEPAFES